MDTDTGIIDPDFNLLNRNGVFVLNEGNFMSGNGSLSFFSYDSSKIYNNIFEGVNHRPLGDIPYSITVTGEKAYIVVNNSGKIEQIDINSVKSLASVSGLVSPRQMAVIDENKAYVSSLYSDFLTIVDLKKNTVSGRINLRRTSEAIAVYGNKAYIASWVSGNEIIIVDTGTDKVVDSLVVGQEPESMVIDKNSDLWVLCSGGYTGEYFPELISINTGTGAIKHRFVFPDKQDSPASLSLNSSGDTLYYINKSVWRMSIDSEVLPGIPFLEQSGRNFYRLGIDHATGDIFVTNAIDYQQRGYLLRLQNDGLIIDSVKTDIIPGNLCFK